MGEQLVGFPDVGNRHRGATRPLVLRGEIEKDELERSGLIHGRHRRV
jgi:hypothetical protein